MNIEAISNSNVTYNGMDAGTKNSRQKVESNANTAPEQVKVENTQTSAVSAMDNQENDGQQDANSQNGQQMSQKFVSEAVDNANSHLPTKTKCEFFYDERTKRVSITIKDKDTDEVIKEIPPKETLEMVAKMWELAGILVDEKR